MRIDFFKGYQPLCKHFTASRVHNYPLVKSVTTKFAEFTTLNEYCSVIKDHAPLGFSLLKGHFTEPLVKESKAGKVDKIAYTRTLILDIDGLILDHDMIGDWDGKRLKNTADAVLNLFPEPFNQTACIVCASSSCGIKNDVRLHIHYILDQEYAPAQIKKLLRSLNLVIPEIRENLSLSSTGKALKYIIDPCLADNTRGVFIAPPIFEGIKNPFKNDDERIVLHDVKKSFNFLNIKSLLDNLPSDDILKEEEVRALKGLHRKRGTTFTPAKTSRRTIDGHSVHLVVNPDPCTMTFSYDNNNYAYYNLGNGDSNAYYVYKNRPEIVYNFKNEEPFLFKEMDKNAYEAHKQRYKNEIEQHRIDKGVVEPKIHMDGDSYICTLFNPATDEIESTIEVNKIKSAENIFAVYGEDVPDIIPLGHRVFDPTRNTPYKENNLTLQSEINTFKPTEFMRQTLIYPIELGYDMANELSDGQRLPFVTFNELCPTLSKIIKHMLGDDDECCNHFINWLAFVWQNRVKPETTWLAQGTQGTGKGLFFRRIIKPLFGKYAQEKMLSHIEDSFTGWIEESLFIMLDEVNIATNRNKGLKETIKNWITESDITIRAMRKDQRQAKSYFAVMMLSNEHGAITIEQGDRRYNVAPRQEQMIQDKYPEVNLDRKGFDAQCDSELPAFVMLLNTLQVNGAAVHKTLNNKAKQDVSEAAMSIGEMFCNAVKQGDLGKLTELMFYTETNNDNAIRLTKAKTIIKEFLANANKGPINVEQEKLRHVFAAFEQKEIAPNRFGAMFRRFGVDNIRRKKGMFVTVDWVISEETLNELFLVMSPTEQATIPTITPPNH